MIIDKDEELLLFLRTLEKNKSLSPFTSLNYSYSDIVKSIIECGKLGYIKIKRDGNEITLKGSEKIKELSSKKGKVILLPRNDVKIEKMELFDIYVPAKKR